MFFPYSRVGQLHLDQGCISQIFIQPWKRLSPPFDWQHLPVHKQIQLILYFSSAVNRSIAIASVTNSLAAIVCSVYGSLAQKASNLSKTANNVLSLSWCESNFIIPLGIFLSVGAVFIICSKTKHKYGFIDKMGSKFKGYGPSTEGQWKALFRIYLITLYQRTQAIPSSDLDLIGFNWRALYDKFAASNSVWISCGGWWILYIMYISR